MELRFETFLKNIISQGIKSLYDFSIKPEEIVLQECFKSKFHTLN